MWTRTSNNALATATPRADLALGSEEQSTHGVYDQNMVGFQMLVDADVYSGSYAKEICRV